MRLLGHPGSDLDETWWKLFPGVSRSFLNSSGTKITVKNTKNIRLSTGRIPGGSWENSITFSQLKIWRSCTPPMISSWEVLVVVFVVLVLVLVVLGVFFLVLVAVVACHYFYYH